MPKNVSQSDIDQMHKFTKYIIGGSLLLFVLVLLGCHFCLKDYPDDNILENALEDIIYEETEIKIDLTPMSPENENRWPTKLRTSA